MMFQGKRWEFVRTKIEENIASNSFAPGEKLPNDLELAKVYGVNRHTVRYAIRALEQKGILRVEQGRGTFVVENPTPYLLSAETRLTDNLVAHGRLARRNILSSDTIPADERLAKHLQLSIGDEVFSIRTLSFQDEVPIVIGHAYFPAQRLPGLLDEFSGANSISKALERVGVADYTQQWVQINARMPTEEEARLLGMSMTMPVFIKENLDCADGKPVKFGENVLCASRINFCINFAELQKQTNPQA